MPDASVRLFVALWRPQNRRFPFVAPPVEFLANIVSGVLLVIARGYYRDLGSHPPHWPIGSHPSGVRSLILAHP
jgi:hypothetical protein